MPYAKDHAEFITITCLNWKMILAEDLFKDVIIDSLRFLVKKDRLKVFAFVIMDNHMHFIWQRLGENEKADVQRDFLKFTGQQILKHLRNRNSEMLAELFVGAKDRKHQVWERNSHSVPLFSDRFLYQKLEYIHYNPVKAGLCKNPSDYRYSSAAFYYLNKNSFDFISHVDG